MGNYASTESVDGLHHRVDTRPIDKEARERVIADLEEMLRAKPESNHPEPKNAGDSAEETVEEIVEETSEKNAEEAESTEVIEPANIPTPPALPSSPVEVKRVKVDQIPLLQSLLKVERANTEIAIREHKERMEKAKKTYEASMSILKVLMDQKDQEIMLLKSEVEAQRKSSEKWRSFYYDAANEREAAEARANEPCEQCTKREEEKKNLFRVTNAFPQPQAPRTSMYGTGYIGSNHYTNQFTPITPSIIEPTVDMSYIIPLTNDPTNYIIRMNDKKYV